MQSNERRWLYRLYRDEGHRAAHAWRHAGLEVELRALEESGAVRVTLERDDWPIEPDWPARELAAYRAAIADGRLEVYVVILEAPARCPSCLERLAAGWETLGVIGSVDVYADDRDTAADYTREVARELLEEHRDRIIERPEPGPCRLERLVSTLAGE